MPGRVCLTGPALRFMDILRPRGLPVSLCILVVDDDEKNLETMEFFLGDEGHEIYTANRGLEAIQVVRRLKEANIRVELSILDYHMPDQTGIDTFLQLTSELPDLEAIFVSGEPSTAIRLGVDRVGGRALVPKPVDVVAMRHALEEFWRERRGFITD